MTNNFDPIELLSYVRYRIYIYRVAGIHRLLEGSKERIEKIYTIPINPKITNRLVSNDSLHHRRSNRARNPRKLVPEIALRTNLVFRNTWRGGKEREREKKEKSLETGNDTLDVPRARDGIRIDDSPGEMGITAAGYVGRVYKRGCLWGQELNGGRARIRTRICGFTERHRGLDRPCTQA